MSQIANSAQQDRRLEELATMPVGRLLWKYSLPAVTGMLVMALYNVIDRMFIGQGVGADAIAGLSLTFPVMSLGTALGVLIGVGSAARLSMLLGAKDMKGAERVVGNELVLTIVIGLIYVSLFGIFMEPMLIWFGADEVTLPYAYQFLMWQLPAMLLANITYSFNNVMRASGYPGRAMFTMIIGAVTNVVLDPIMIFGMDMGIKGASIATDISMTVSAIFVVAHFMRHDVTISFRRAEYRLHGRTLWEIVSLGAAPALINAASCLINIMIVKTLRKYGDNFDLAAMGIFVTYTNLLVVAMLGICQGLQPIMGYNYGAGLFHRLKRVFGLAVAASTIIGAVGTIIALAWPEIIARIFNGDPRLIDVTSHSLRLVIWAFWTVGIQIMATALFQSTNRAGASIFISLCRQVIFLVPLLYFMPDFLGKTGVWLSFPISDLCSTIATLIMVGLMFHRLKSNQSNLRD